MKKIYLTLMCMACLSMLTGCGDKKADKGAEGESTEVADNQTEGQDATEQGGDEAGSETWGDPAKAAPLDLAALYSSGDFKPASTIIFVDTLAGEKKGEVPTKWEVTNGSAEVAEANGSSYITLLSGDVEMKPKVNGNTNNYLPDSYTMEFQFMFGQDVFYYVRFYNAEDDEFGHIGLRLYEANWGFTKTDDEQMDGLQSDLDKILKRDGWNHLAMSYDKGNLKLFFNGKRVANMTNIKPFTYFVISATEANGKTHFLKNFCIAK